MLISRRLVAGISAGRDVGRLLTDTSRQIVAQVLSQELDQLGATALAMAMIRKEGGYYGDSDSAIALLVDVQKGVSETPRCVLIRRV